MKIEKKNLDKSQIELKIELTEGEFKPYVEKAAVKVSEEVKVEGFRRISFKRFNDSNRIPYRMVARDILCSFFPSRIFKRWSQVFKVILIDRSNIKREPLCNLSSIRECGQKKRI